MACFSLGWIEQLLVWLIILVAVVGILKLLIPWIVGQIGVSFGPLPQIINIVLWAAVAIFIIYISFELISCLLGSAGLFRR